jgi:methyl-accepting chemotaxis protein
MQPLQKTFRALSLKSKIRFYILSIAGLTLLAVSGYLIFSIRSISKHSAVSITDEMVLNHAKDITKSLSKDISFVSSIASASKFYFDKDIPSKDSLMKRLLVNLAQDNPQYKAVWLTLEYASFNPLASQTGRKLFAAELADGRLDFALEDRNMKGEDSNGLYEQVKAKPALTVLDPYFDTNSKGKNSLVTSVIAPISSGGTFAGIAGVDFSLSSYAGLASEIRPYDGTIAFIFTSNGYIVSHTNQALVGKLFGETGKDGQQQVVLDSVRSGKGIRYDETIEGVPYYTRVVPISIGNDGKCWALGISIPKSEIYHAANRVTLIAVLLCLLGLASIVISTSIFSRRLTVPIEGLTRAIKRLAKGEISEANKLALTTRDEIGEMADSVNSLIDGLKGTATFAENIGEGKLDTHYTLLGDNDFLGKSLLDMRQNLVASRQEAERRKVEDEKQAWATNGIARFAELLRENNHDIRELSFSIVKNLVSYLNAVQGGLFVINDADTSDVYLEMTACFAYDRRKLHQARIEIGEGLVGRCFYEKEPIYLLDIPQDYVTITSGLGDARPCSLLLVPLKLNDTVSGVVELASLRPIEEYQIRFVEKVAESIASTLTGVRVNIQTSELLARTQQQAEEMAAQEEEMRQNLEELTSTQEEMARVHDEQVRAKDLLAHEQLLFNNLLASVPDLVYYKDLNFRITHCSKSLLDKNGNTINEVVGKTDVERFGEVGYRTLDDEQEIVRTGKPMLNVEESFTYPDGRVEWLNTSKMPLHNVDGKIIGTFGITRDITAVKTLSEELRQEKEKHEASARHIDELMNENRQLKHQVKALEVQQN